MSKLTPSIPSLAQRLIIDFFTTSTSDYPFSKLVDLGSLLAIPASFFQFNERSSSETTLAPHVNLSIKQHDEYFAYSLTINADRFKESTLRIKENGVYVDDNPDVNDSNSTYQVFMFLVAHDGRINIKVEDRHWSYGRAKRWVIITNTLRFTIASNGRRYIFYKKAGFHPTLMQISFRNIMPLTPYLSRDFIKELVLLNRPHNEFLLEQSFSELTAHAYNENDKLRLPLSQTLLKDVSSMKALYSKLANCSVPAVLTKLSLNVFVELLALLPSPEQSLNRIGSVIKASPNNKWSIQDLFVSYYYARFGFDYMSNNAQTMLRDYLRMLRSENMPVNLTMRSYNRLVQEHDALSKATKLRNMIDFKVDDLYREFELHNEKLSIQLVATPEELIDESNTMSHCVHSYANSIAKRISVVYHVDYLNTPYTVQVNPHADTPLAQVKGKYNAQPPKELLIKLNKHFKRSRLNSIGEQVPKLTNINQVEYRREANWLEDLPF